MPQFWIKVDEQEAPAGPYEAIDLQRMANEGSLAPEWFISNGGKKYYRADRIKGLLPTNSNHAEAGEVAGAEAIEWTQDGSARMPAPGLGAATGGGYARAAEGPGSGLVTTFWLMWLLMLPAWAGQLWAGVIAARHPNDPRAHLVAMAASLLFTLACGAALVIWLIWIFKAHAAVRTRREGIGATSPGMAVGLSLIPIFSAFWAVYMPAKLAKRVNRISVHGNAVSVPGVVIMQVLSVLLAWPAAGVAPLCYAITMTMMQRGLKRALAES